MPRPGQASSNAESSNHPGKQSFLNSCSLGRTSGAQIGPVRWSATPEPALPRPGYDAEVANRATAPGAQRFESTAGSGARAACSLDRASKQPEWP